MPLAERASNPSLPDPSLPSGARFAPPVQVSCPTRGGLAPSGAEAIVFSFDHDSSVHDGGARFGVRGRLAVTSDRAPASPRPAGRPVSP